jgi:hypothetical protein
LDGLSLAFLLAIHLGKDLQQLESRATKEASLSDSTAALWEYHVCVLVLRWPALGFGLLSRFSFRYIFKYWPLSSFRVEAFTSSQAAQPFRWVED